MTSRYQVDSAQIRKSLQTHRHTHTSIQVVIKASNCHFRDELSNLLLYEIGVMNMKLRKMREMIVRK